jgi:hypothetical protein
MDELVCDVNQYDVPHGDLSCNAASLCCARLLLEKGGTGITKDDLYLALQAGGTLYSRWHQRDPVASLTCWRDVVRLYPALFEGYNVAFETNGFLPGHAPLPSDAASFGYATFDAALDAVGIGEEKGGNRVGVLTSKQGSYTIGFERPYWYVFDPHGTPNATHAHHASPATLRRTQDREAFKNYLTREVLGAATGGEFHLVLFGPHDVHPGV